MPLKNNFYDIKTINCIEIDVSSYCNASCGCCDRNVDGGEVVKNLPLVNLSYNKWKSLITKENLKYINEIKFNGNFGDCSMHPNIIDMLEELNKVDPDLFINAHTNGGARNESFWKQLGITLNKFHNHRVVFGIDGLEDSHNIYRRGLNWNARIKNARAFINANGYAIWKCIVFDYNINQLKDIENFAKEQGFSVFETNRNFTNTAPMHLPSYKNFPDVTITSPKDFSKYKVQKIFKNENYKPKKFKKNYSKRPIGTFNCLYGKEGMIQIDMEGYVWPCCWLSGRRFENNHFNSNRTLNIENKTLNEILNDNMFNSYLKNAWQNKTITTCNKCPGVYDSTPVYKI